MSLKIVKYRTIHTHTQTHVCRIQCVCNTVQTLYVIDFMANISMRSRLNERKWSPGIYCVVRKIKQNEKMVRMVRFYN